MGSYSSDSYFTIASSSEAKYTEKMSKFLSFAFPVQSVSQARGRIDEMARKYHDARHVCWAYMIGPKRMDCLSSDNGEPSGTAGKPILGQINSFNLTDVVVVVVRYFGGIKLGTSGLISAYREAARLALSEAVIQEMHVMVDLDFSFPYMSVNEVMKVIKQPDVTVRSQVFDNSCSVGISVREEMAGEVRGRLSKVSGLTFSE